MGYEVRHANTGRISENHQVHVFIDGLGEKHELYRKLMDNNLSTNFDDILGGRLFIRLGTQEITRRGMKEKEMPTIASIVDSALKEVDVRKKVIDFNRSYPEIKYSFDR
jgi:glycine hydroxymethyltransferase